MSDNMDENARLSLLDLPEDILQDMLLLLDGDDLGTCRLVGSDVHASCTDLTFVPISS